MINLEVFVHDHGHGKGKVSCQAWWVSGSGLQHAVLCAGDEIDLSTSDGGPWGLLRAFYLHVAGIKRAIDLAERGLEAATGQLPS